jgi:hypothetical protein
MFWKWVLWTYLNVAGLNVVAFNRVARAWYERLSVHVALSKSAQKVKQR